MADDTRTIHERLADIMAEVPAIPKGEKNREQGYAFRGIDDVYNTLHALFAKHGVVVLPQVLNAEYVDRDMVTAKGHNRLAIDARLQVRYHFIGREGDEVAITTQGESRDYADKATNQAMSSGFKYGLLQMFLIPVKEGNADADRESPTGAQAPRSKEPPVAATPDEMGADEPPPQEEPDPMDRLKTFTLGKTPGRSTARQSGITLAVELADKAGLEAQGEDSWAAWLEVALTSFEKSLSQMTADETTALYETLQAAIAPALKEAEKDG